MKAVLDNCFVVDVTEGAQGPFAASLLADLGATVVKIERSGGELMRHGIGPRRNGVPLALLSISRGRVASVSVDLKSESDRDYLLDLVRSADVFIENWRPGTAERLRVDRDSLIKINPTLVYLSASGFGSTGPFAHLGSMDAIAAASGGLASVSGQQNGRTERYRLALLDFVSAMVTAEMALAALLQRQLSGRSVWGETSQLESAVAVASTLMERPDTGDGSEPDTPLGSSDPWAVPSFIVQAADGVHVALNVDTEAQWLGLVDALSIRADSNWQQAQSRRQSRGEIERVVAQHAAELGTDALLSRLRSGGVPCAVVHRSMRAALNTPEICDTHIAWRKAENVGWIAMAQAPWRFADVRVRAGWPCPALGVAVVDGWQEEWGKG